MAEETFPLITPQQTSNNENSEYGINKELQIMLANGNSQFALDIARELKISYSIPTIALQISARFFHLRCYINFDRFMIVLACIILAHKLKYMEFRIKDIVFGFYKVINYRTANNEPFDEKKLHHIKNEICKAENEVLRTLEYSVAVITPHDYLSKVLSISFPPEIIKSNKDNKILITARIIILDSNRTLCSLYFSPLTICVSALLIASRYEKLKPYVFMQNKSTNTTNVDKTDEELYHDWLDALCVGEAEKLKPENILACIEQINLIFTLVNN